MYQKKLFPLILIVGLYLVHDPPPQKKNGALRRAQPQLMLDILTYEWYSSPDDSPGPLWGQLQTVLKSGRLG